MDRNERQSEDLSNLSNRDLLSHIAQTVSLLARKEVELARTELQSEARQGAFMVGEFGVALAAGFVTLILLLVTVILALSLVLPAWAAGLIVSGITLLTAIIAALIGWRNRVRSLLPHTTELIKEDLRWTKNRNR